MHEAVASEAATMEPSTKSQFLNWYSGCHTNRHIEAGIEGYRCSPSFDALPAHTL